MSFRKALAYTFAFGMPAIFVGLAAGLSPDAVVKGAAAAAWLFIFFNYRPS